MINLGKKVHLHTSALVLVGAMCVLGSIRVVGACLVSIVIHEVGHYIAIRLVGEDYKAFYVNAFGIKLEKKCGHLTRPKVLSFIAWAGPVANFAAAFLFLCFGKSLLAMMNLLIGACNLLPAFPLDGGNILFCFLSPYVGRRKARRLVRWCGFFIGVLALAGGVYMLVRTAFNITLLLIGAVVVICAVKDGYNPLAEAIVSKDKVYQSALYTVDAGKTAMETASYVTPGSVVAVKGKEGTIIGFTTPEEIYEKMQETDGKITVGQCLK